GSQWVHWARLADRHQARRLADPSGGTRPAPAPRCRSGKHPTARDDRQTDGAIGLSSIRPVCALRRRAQRPAGRAGKSWGRSYWIPGAYAPPWSEKHPSLLKAIAKEGLQGGKGDNNEVGRHRHIHDPGIQQEPSQIEVSKSVEKVRGYYNGARGERKHTGD